MPAAARQLGVTDVAADFGRKFKIPVAETLVLEEDFIILLDYYQASQAHSRGNLFRLRADGTVVWAITLPDPTDLITKVERRNGRLIAWTWRCCMITIDASNGTILESVFMK